MPARMGGKVAATRSMRAPERGETRARMRATAVTALATMPRTGVGEPAMARERGVERRASRTPRGRPASFGQCDRSRVAVRDPARGRRRSGLRYNVHRLRGLTAVSDPATGYCRNPGQGRPQ